MARRTVEGPGGTQATHAAPNPEFGDISEDLGRETRHTGIQDELRTRAQRAVEVSSEYVRDHDIDEMYSDLEREIRAHPIKSVALALGAGYVLGRLFR